MKRTSRRSGFTLVEMLVVVTIIGILTAILIPTVGAVVSQGKLKAMKLEITQLMTAIEEYKLDKNDYPPDFSNNAAVVAHMTRAFPRLDRFIRPNVTLPSWLVTRTGTQPVMGTDYVWPNWEAGAIQPDATRLDPAESLVFWLSGLKTNAKNPFYGGGEKKIYFDFKTEQLTDVDEDGWPEYSSPHAKEVPYVYFDGRVQNAIAGPARCAYGWTVYPCLWSVSGAQRAGGIGGTGQNVVQIPAPADLGFGAVRPYRSVEPLFIGDPNNPIWQDTFTWPRSTTLDVNDTAWLKPKSFQIVAPGLDGKFGVDHLPNNVLVFKKYPVPNYYSAAGPGEFKVDRDNITSFSEKSIGDSIP